MAIEGKTSVFSVSYDTSKVGKVIATKSYSDYTLASGYVPADYDVVARVADDSNKFAEYDPTDANHVVVGIIGTYDSDKSVIEMIDKAEDAVLLKLGIVNIGSLSAAESLTAVEALRAQGIHTI